MYATHPPNSPLLPLSIIRPKEGKKLYFVALNECYQGVLTHYTGRQNVRCKAPDLCPGCLAGQSQRYNGYIIGQSPQSHTVVMVHLTRNATTMLKPFTFRKGGLYGHLILLERGEGSSRKKVTAKMLERKTCAEPVTQDILRRQVATIYRDNEGDQDWWNVDSGSNGNQQ